jgi:hypothetical protein
MPLRRLDDAVPGRVAAVLVPYTEVVVPMPVPNAHPTTPKEIRWLFRPAMNPR